MKDEHWRLFVAAPLPSELAHDLAAVRYSVRDLLGRASWVKPTAMHLTLRFLGDTPVRLVPELCESLGLVALGARAFNLGLGALGGFPNLRRPRVFWVGVDDEAALAELAAGVDEALETLGFAPSDRAFKAHLTLCRLKGRGAARDLPAARSIMAEAIGVCGLAPHILGFGLEVLWGALVWSAIVLVLCSPSHVQIREGG